MVGGAHGMVFGADDAAEGRMRCAVRAGLRLAMVEEGDPDATAATGRIEHGFAEV